MEGAYPVPRRQTHARGPRTPSTPRIQGILSKLLLDVGEVEATVRSAYRYEAGNLLRCQESSKVGVLLSDVEPESVEWLWDGRIPLGKITNLDGDPGKGKSVAMMDITARMTTGRPMPDGDLDHVGS